MVPEFRRALKNSGVLDWTRPVSKLSDHRNPALVGWISEFPLPLPLSFYMTLNCSSLVAHEHCIERSFFPPVCTEWMEREFLLGPLPGIQDGKYRDCKECGDLFQRLETHMSFQWEAKWKTLALKPVVETLALVFSGFREIAPLTIIASFLWNGAHWWGVPNHLIKRVLLRDLGAF